MRSPAPKRDLVLPSAARRVQRPITKDDEVEIAATFLGSFILGVSFAKDFFLHGKFEIRIFFLGISCFVLFMVIAVLARIRIRLLDRTRPLLSAAWLVLFALGNAAAVDLFNHQFIAASLDGDIRLETTLFLVCFSASTNLLFVLNRVVLLAVLQPKTVYKYLLAPINGISSGAIVTGFFVWLFG